MKIVDYYTRMAPQNLPPQNREPVTEFTDRFVVKEPGYKETGPSATYIKIDPGNQLIYAGNAYDSSFSVFNNQLQLVKNQKTGGITVHLDFDQSLSVPGQRSGLLTNIGSFYPTNERTGTIDSFYISAAGNIKLTSIIADSLPRPVQTVRLDGKDRNNLIVCGFGHESGELYDLYKNENEKSFNKKILSQLPGAVSACVDDYNKDGLPDIIVLFAQADEAICVFINKGNGNFESKTLLRFPPVYGSTSFEMQDLNGDGLKDIIYTCGDNYDYSRVLKNYHGIYLFLNHGDQGFKQEYFFPVNGCYKAIGRDFDNDRDIDIAAISFFPDIKNQPQESFVYLRNNGGLRFSPSGIREFNTGNWITMDAGDVDADGDEDIVIGSLLLRDSNAPTNTLVKQKKAPPFLLLENKTR